MTNNQGLCIVLVELSSVRPGGYRFGDIAMSILGRSVKPYVRIEHGRLNQISEAVKATNGQASLNMAVTIPYPLRADALVLRVFDGRGCLCNLFGVLADPFIGEASLKLSDLDLSKTQEHVLLVRRGGYIEGEVKVRVQVESQDNVSDGGAYTACYDLRMLPDTEEGYMKEAPLGYNYGNSVKGGAKFDDLVDGLVQRYDLALVDAIAERYDLALVGSDYNTAAGGYDLALGGYDVAPLCSGATNTEARNGYNDAAISNCKYDDTSSKAIVDKYDLAVHNHGATHLQAGQEYRYCGKVSASCYSLDAPTQAGQESRHRGKAASNGYSLDAYIQAGHEYGYGGKAAADGSTTDAPKDAGQEYGHHGKAATDGAPHATASLYDLSLLGMGGPTLTAAQESDYHVPTPAAQDYQGTAPIAGEDYNYVVPTALEGSR